MFKFLSLFCNAEGGRIFTTGSTLQKRFFKKQFKKIPLVNERIRTPKVRVIDVSGEQLGIMELKDALIKAKERSLDLVQVTERIEPPVCKILDYGKYLYQQKKKEKTDKSKSGEIKGIRLSFAISEHDLETRVNQTEKFLEKGYRVRVAMPLKGRQKGLDDFAREKIEKFLVSIKERVSIKIEKELKKETRGFIMIIAKASRE